MPACRCCCWTSSARARPTATRSPKARSKRLLKTDPARLHGARRRRSWSRPAISRTISAEIAGCDWIIEAVIERLDIKQALYREARRRAQAGHRGVARTPRPSRSPIWCRACRSAFARDFLITHFFNPPRYMRLLEMVAAAGDRSRPGRRGQRIRRHGARQDHRRLQGHAGLHRQPPRRLLAAARPASKPSISGSRSRRPMR